MTKGVGGLNTKSLDAPELLRWWQRYQIQRQNQTADTIRNGLLQDVFALRRQLELFCQTCSTADVQSCDRQVAQLHHVYFQLEDLSNSLDLPYLQDSLPLERCGRGTQQTRTLAKRLRGKFQRSISETGSVCELRWPIRTLRRW